MHYSQTCFSDHHSQAITCFMISKFVFRLTVLTKHVLGDHLSYITILKFSFGGSRKFNCIIYKARDAVFFCNSGISTRNHHDHDNHESSPS
jgi:hypothetical protein